MLHIPFGSCNICSFSHSSMSNAVDSLNVSQVIERARYCILLRSCMKTNFETSRGKHTSDSLSFSEIQRMEIYRMVQGPRRMSRLLQTSNTVCITLLES